MHENVPFSSFVTVTYSRAGTKISTIGFIFHLDWHFVSQSKASLVGFTSISSFVEVTYSRAGTIWVTIDFKRWHFVFYRATPKHD